MSATSTVAVANKVIALIRRAEEHDPGFDRRVFAQALTAIERLPDSECTVDGLDADRDEVGRRWKLRPVLSRLQTR